MRKGRMKKERERGDWRKIREEFLLRFILKKIFLIFNKLCSMHCCSNYIDAYPTLPLPINRDFRLIIFVTNIFLHVIPANTPISFLLASRKFLSVLTIRADFTAAWIAVYRWDIAADMADRWRSRREIVSRSIYICNMQMDGRTGRAPRRLPPVFEITDGNLVSRLPT